MTGVSGGRSGDELLRKPVRLHGIELGRSVDLYVDPVAVRVIGIAVLCGDGQQRFLPLAGARVDPEQIAVQSALTLLDSDQLSFYRDRARTLSSLRGAEVEVRGALVGHLRSIELEPDGRIAGVSTDARHVPVDDGVRLRHDRPVAPAA
jgi:hypothetical protein